MFDLLPIPTVAELKARWDSDVISKFPTAKPQVRFSFFNILGTAHAILLHGLYLFVQNIAKQIFVTTATGSFLVFHGSDYGVSIKAATSATGDIIVTGTNGSTVSIGTKLKVGSIQYKTLALATISGGTATVAVQAINFGTNTNQAAAVTLNFITTPVGIDNDATVDTGLTGGIDRETDEQYRARILFRKRNAIQCGAPSDYIQWQLEAPGVDVTNAFVYPKELGDCNVTVRFMTYNTTADGIPSAGDVTLVNDFLENERVGAGVVLTTAPPVAVPVAYNITISPDNATVRAAVEQQLRDLHLREAEPAGATSGGGLAISKIRAAVSNATGEDTNTVNSPAVSIPSGAAGDISTFGSIVFS